jgi:hypothetical protein
LLAAAGWNWIPDPFGADAVNWIWLFDVQGPPAMSRPPIGLGTDYRAGKRRSFGQLKVV